MIDPPPDEPPEESQPAGTLQPTSPKALTVWGLVGLVGGWLFHAYADRQMTSVPGVTWSQPLALLLVAAILGLTARVTWRDVRDRRPDLPAHQAVNRLVLARACAYVGVLAAGAYFGYAISWVGVRSDLPGQGVVRPLLAGIAGACVLVTALLLERACRVRKDQDDA